jgi:Ricin-type beta-trefoil lectin domain-like
MLSFSNIIPKEHFFMKKALFLLLGLVTILAIAQLSATSFAAKSTRTAKSHPIHFFLHMGHTPQSASVSRAASSSNIPYNGGPVMAGTTNVYAIFWEPTGNVSANYNSLIKRYFGDVGGSSLYKISNQYTQTGGAFPSNALLAGSWVDPGAYPESPLLDSDIQNEVTHAQSVNNWSSNIDNVFFVFTERNENICADITQAQCATNMFCAYHSFFGTNTIYAAMPYASSFSCNTGFSPNNDDADQTINVTSHEQMEAATDPLINAWVDLSNPNSGEIGDMCAWTFGPVNSQGADVVWNNHGYIVQKEWSNAISGCTLTTSTATKYYKIVNRKSGLVMDVYGGSTNAGAHVIQWSYHNGLNQQWALVAYGNYYQLVNHKSGLVMDVYGGAKNAGAQVIQWTNHHGLNQQWSLVTDGNYIQIVNRNSGLVLDVFGGGTTQGVNVIQWTNHHGSNQQWSLIPV